VSDAFRWNDWNRDHIADHGVLPEEAEYVVNRAAAPYPEFIGDGKWRVRGADVQRPIPSGHLRGRG
jgi:hypothetical protein